MNSIKASNNMLTKNEALELVSKKLNEMDPTGEPCVVVDSHTIEKPFGWSFSTTRKSLLKQAFLDTDSQAMALSS